MRVRFPLPAPALLNSLKNTRELPLSRWNRARAADLARRHGVSEAPIYSWKAKYGGLEASETRRLRELENENARLKRLLADAMLDNVALKDLLSEKW